MGEGRGIPPLFGCDPQSGDEMERRGRGQRLSPALRLHGPLPLQQRAGVERAHARPQRAACLLRARRPAGLRAHPRRGQASALVDNYQGKRLNSPNDGCFKSNGDLYFTDPPYGLPKLADDPMRELDFCGVYRVSPDGKVTLLTKDMTRPNGIAFSPDEKTLYVAQSDPKAAVWMAFPVLEDGTLGPGKVFADVTKNAGKMPGLPDGMKVDAKGNLFATGPGGCHVFSPDGKLLGRIETGEATANYASGGTTAACSTCARICISAASKRPPRGPAGKVRLERRLVPTMSDGSADWAKCGRRAASRLRRCGRRRPSPRPPDGPRCRTHTIRRSACGNRCNRGRDAY